LSQRVVLNELLAINNAIEGNQLVLTTHSPYVINYLTLAIKMGMLKQKHGVGKLDGLDDVVPLRSAILPEEVAIYQLLNDGELGLLDTYEGLPADSNVLNEALGETNELFDRLLEKEDALA